MLLFCDKFIPLYFLSKALMSTDSLEDLMIGMQNSPSLHTAKQQINKVSIIGERATYLRPYVRSV